MFIWTLARKCPVNRLLGGAQKLPIVNSDPTSRVTYIKVPFLAQRVMSDGEMKTQRLRIKRQAKRT